MKYIITMRLIFAGGLHIISSWYELSLILTGFKIYLQLIYNVINIVFWFWNDLMGKHNQFGSVKYKAGVNKGNKTFKRVQHFNVTLCDMENSYMINFIVQTFIYLSLTSTALIVNIYCHGLLIPRQPNMCLYIGKSYPFTSIPFSLRE